MHDEKRKEEKVRHIKLDASDLTSIVAAILMNGGSKDYSIPATAVKAAEEIVGRSSAGEVKG